MGAMLRSELVGYYSYHRDTDERAPLHTDCVVCGKGLQLDRDRELGDQAWEYAREDITDENGGHFCLQCIDDNDLEPDERNHKVILLVDALECVGDA